MLSETRRGTRQQRPLRGALHTASATQSQAALASRRVFFCGVQRFAVGVVQLSEAGNFAAATRVKGKCERATIGLVHLMCERLSERVRKRKTRSAAASANLLYQPRGTFQRAVFTPERAVPMHLRSLREDALALSISAFEKAHFDPAALHPTRLRMLFCFALRAPLAYTGSRHMGTGPVIAAGSLTRRQQCSETSATSRSARRMDRERQYEYGSISGDGGE